MLSSSSQYFSLKPLALTGLVFLPLFGLLFWHLSTTPDTLSELTTTYPTLGEKVVENLSSLPTLPIQETKEHFTIEDSKPEGIEITYANETNTELKTAAPKQTVSFPKDSTQPIEVKLDETRSIPITHLSEESYTLDTLTKTDTDTPFYQRLFQRDDAPREYLRYESDRKTLLYAYEKDQATGEKRLKHWTLYETGTGLEEERYQFDHVKLKINDKGAAEVFYYGEQQIKNDAAAQEVAPSLLERAQRTLEKELGQDVLNNQTPDFVIPKPYYLDSQGEQHDLEWKWDEATKTLSVSFSPESYPVALDPTLQFTAPGMSNTGSVITGERGAIEFGSSLEAGDFNTDGRVDLAVGAYLANSTSGKVYIFYNDGEFTSLSDKSDVFINGTGGYFGWDLQAGDFNTDGRIDLAVGTSSHPSVFNSTFIFYNDGQYPTSAASADVTITGTSSNLGQTLAAGDLNYDGRTDLIVSTITSGLDGVVYIFYNDGSLPTTTGTADVTITGSTGTRFGSTLITGDFDADGKVDLAIGAPSYSSSTGRVYVFYGDGSIPTTEGTADVVLTGESTNQRFGGSNSANLGIGGMASGDFNSDGKTDLAVSARIYGTNTGRVYLFYNGAITTKNASAADTIITGSVASIEFGTALAGGDFNGDGRTDLAVGAHGHTGDGFAGRAYIFYNDGAYPSTAATADVAIIGETTVNALGLDVVAADLNSDGKTDLAVSAPKLFSSAGRVYIFYSQNGQVNTNFSITGNATSDQFGYAMTTGDVNADGRTDLIVGANAYSTSTGRAYIFYGDGQIPTTAGTADVTITGNATSDEFGKALITGDFDADGDIDLAVGAPGYSTNTGRVYLFYNDGSLPTTAGTADVTITGESTSNYFGYALAAGNMNTSNQRTDLIASAYGYSSNTGRVYLFLNDGSYTSAAGSADTVMSGSANNNFGQRLVVGDFNADGRKDLGATVINASGGHTYAYLFYNDGSIPTSASSADVIFDSGSNDVAFNMAAGDFNSDGREDLVIVTRSATGTAYVLYNDGSIPTTTATADVTITGETNSFFGAAVTAGDFNADGRTDFALGADGYTTNTGRTYIFYNDGSLPTTAATADIIITGETTSNYFGFALATGDMNGDSRTDLIVGAYGNTSSTGKVYLYETRENFAWDIQRQTGSTPRTNVNGSGQEMKVTGKATSSDFGYTLATGDFNADGKLDLAVGADIYSSNNGEVYIFYSDGSLPTGAASADAVIARSTGGFFGAALAAGDMNNDGRTDLIASAPNPSNGTVYIFYNDGTYPATNGAADRSITGESNNDNFGTSIAVGDLNSDGESDLIVTAPNASSNAGRAYIFYNDGSIPTTAGTADVTITGESLLGGSSKTLVTGDFDADGDTDLAVGAPSYSTSTGRVYLFYNDGGYPATAASADIILTGEATSNNFGAAITAGDFNADGEVDLAAGARGYSSSTGRVYIFHNGSIITENASGADTIISGESVSSFGASITGGDFNGDGKTDLGVGGYSYSSSTGRTYILYNDGSYPSAASADIILTGEATSNFFGYSVIAGDFNADGRIDIAVGAIGYTSNRGRVYVYTLKNDPVITANTINTYFGRSVVTGDFNADGKTDLVVGASNYSTATGRVYIFYNDSIYPSAADSADAILTGETTSNNFGITLAAGDFNFDGKTDIAVGASGYSTSTGRAYIFYNGSITTENASGADVTITGNATSDSFGYALVAGDFNFDGRVDLTVGAYGYSTSTGRAYIFYNDAGGMPTTAGTADVTITGGGTNNRFGVSLAAGDLNTDGRTDLIVGTDSFATYVDTAYIFYNDTGGMPTTAGTADVILTGTASTGFGAVLATGDWNSDGRTDLAVGTTSASGAAYLFYNDGTLPTTAATADVTITSEASAGIGSAIAAGDFNRDGRIDLVLGASGYTPSSTGRVYVFYNDGSYPSLAASADAMMTGTAAWSYFGISLATGDMNNDGIVDIVVGAGALAGDTGGVYIFASEAAATSVQPATSYLKGTGKLKGTAKLK